MGAEREFDAETRERAVGCIWIVWPSTATPRSVLADTSKRYSMSNVAIIGNWAEKNEPVASVHYNGTAVDRDAEPKSLRRENAELRSAAEVLKRLSALFAIVPHGVVHFGSVNHLVRDQRVALYIRRFRVEVSTTQRSCRWLLRVPSWR